MDGLFQIVREMTATNSDDLEVIGTAFAIETSNSNPHEYHLLTAYHNISEILIKNKPLLVRDCSLNILSAEIIYPSSFQTYSELSRDDYALIKLISDEKYRRYSLRNISGPMECYVRGASSYYAQTTMFTPFYGKMFWKEAAAQHPDKAVLVIDLLTKEVYNSNQVRINLHNIIGGMSGSPIIVCQDQKEYVVGVFIRIFPDGSASKCYGIPASTVINDCLIPKGLYSELSIEGKHLFIPSVDNRLVVNLYIDSLFGDSSSFSLEDFNEEARIWNSISNQLYLGNEVDAVLYQATCAQDFEHYSADARVALRYYLARLFFKRGQKKKAFEQLKMIDSDYKKLSTHVSERVAALVSARRTVESEIKDLNVSLDLIRHSGDRIEVLQNVDDIYIANEMASICGRGLTNILGKFTADNWSTSIRKAISEVFDIHSQLLIEHPIPLKKQDVVNTSLSWLINMWEIAHPSDEEKLRRDAILGFQQAKHRKNSIFHIQSLIAYAISLVLSGTKKGALISLFVVAHLMDMEKIKITHEGIEQLLWFLKNEHIEYYSLFCLYYDVGLRDEKTFLEKSSLYCMGVSNLAMGSLIERARYIFNNIYTNTRRCIYLCDPVEITELIM